jgi:hypothetical protein
MGEHAHVRAASEFWGRARTLRAIVFPDLRVMTMTQANSKGIPKQRTNSSRMVKRTLFDRELGDLPADLRWREWMMRVEAVIFASAEPVSVRPWHVLSARIAALIC